MLATEEGGQNQPALGLRESVGQESDIAQTLRIAQTQPLLVLVARLRAHTLQMCKPVKRSRTGDPDPVHARGCGPVACHPSAQLAGPCDAAVSLVCRALKTAALREPRGRQETARW